MKKTVKKRAVRKHPPTPELDKLRKVREKAQIISEFVAVFLREKNICLCKRCNLEHRDMDPEYTPFATSLEDLLAEFFGLDSAKIVAEYRRALTAIRGEMRPKG